MTDTVGCSFLSLRPLILWKTSCQLQSQPISPMRGLTGDGQQGTQVSWPVPCE